MKILRFALITAVLLGPPALKAADPFLGKWNLDVKRSKYSPGTCPKSMVIEMNSVGGAVHYHSDTLLTNGRSIRADYTADYNGEPTIVMGVRGMLLPVSLKRVSRNSVVASYTSALQVVATSRRVISPDAKVMTITTKSRDVSGKTVVNVGVYEKIKPAPTGYFDFSKSNTLLLESK